MQSLWRSTELGPPPNEHLTRGLDPLKCPTRLRATIPGNDWRTKWRLPSASQHSTSCLTTLQVASVALRDPFWRHTAPRMESEATVVEAEARSAAARILAESRADSLRIHANAVADARAALVSSDSLTSGVLDISETVRQRIEFQETKRQQNIGSVVAEAAMLLEGKEVEQSEPNHDWTARFLMKSKTCLRPNCSRSGQKSWPVKLNAPQAHLYELSACYAI